MSAVRHKRAAAAVRPVAPPAKHARRDVRSESDASKDEHTDEGDSSDSGGDDNATSDAEVDWDNAPFTAYPLPHPVPSLQQTVDVFPETATMSKEQRNAYAAAHGNPDCAVEGGTFVHLATPLAAQLQRQFTRWPTGLPPELRQKKPPTRFFEVIGAKLMLPPEAWYMLQWNPRRRVEWEPAALPADAQFHLQLPLKKYQRKTVDAFKARFKEYHAGTATLPAGTGKTRTINTLIWETGLRTWVLNTSALLCMQSAADARAAFSGVSVSVLSSYTPRDTDADIVFASAKSVKLGLERQEPALMAALRKVGLLVVDEAQSTVSRTVMFVLTRLCTRYRAGFTAEFARSDGHEAMVPYILGPPVCSVRRPPIPVIPQIMALDDVRGLRCKDRHEGFRAIARSAVVNDELEYLIAHEAMHVVPAGGRVLVLFQLVAQAVYMAKRLGYPVSDKMLADSCKSDAEGRLGKIEVHFSAPASPIRWSGCPDLLGTVGLFIGDMDELARDANKTSATILCATLAAAGTGQDFKDMHAVIGVAQPKLPTQFTGRGLRLGSMAKHPRITFVVFPKCRAFASRAKTYATYCERQEGWLPIRALSPAQVRKDVNAALEKRRVSRQAAGVPVYTDTASTVPAAGSAPPSIHDTF
jgi:hypothetical protein